LSSLSYTALSELERCGYRYYLERVLGIPEDRDAARASGGDRSLEARARGTLIHRLMETFDFAMPQPVSPAEVAVAARELGLRVAPGEREEIAALIARASAAGPAARLAAAHTVRREHPFAFSLGPREPLIAGVIDLLAVEPDGGCLIVDYKSDRVGSDVELVELVEREYGVQRLLYALAVLREGAARVEIVHWFLERPEQPVGARFQAAEQPELDAQLAARIARAREQSFVVSPNPHRGLCLTCPGRAGLCSWGEAETSREQPAELRADGG
jgi:ATP-dependent exoDNAse (exonuclease V) beta subunit